MTGGYAQVGLWKNNRPRHFFVHRLVAAAFIGACPAGKQVNHKDCDRENNHYTNLEYVTPSDNVRHSYANGRDVARGMRSPHARLTDDDVRDVRRRAAQGESRLSLAREFGVSYPTIHNACSGRGWAHINGPLTTGRRTKLSTENLRRIRAASKKGSSRAEIARQFGVSASHVSNILLGKKRRSS